MPNPYYNPNSLVASALARAADVNRELEKIQQAFAKLPEPATIPIGSEGTPRYIHIAFADSADGTANFTTGSQGARAYMGLETNSTSETPSAFAEDYTWVRIRGADGDDGAPGDDGLPGSDGLDGVRVEIRYIRSFPEPDPAVGRTPAGTSTTRPSGVPPLWQTSALINADNTLASAWEPWERISVFPPPTAYDPAVTYYGGMQVLHQGGTYILIVQSSTGNAPTGTAQANAYWDVVAAPGGEGNPATPPSAFTATIDLTNSSTGANLRALADAAGYTGHSDATITFRVPASVTINGAPGGGIAIDTGTWPTSSYTIGLSVQVMNGGVVNGGGGSGGRGGTGSSGGSGSTGGDAIYQRVALTSVTVDSGGILRGGGGGGGGGAGARTIINGEPAGSAGGGGGGGRPNGAGGAGGYTLQTAQQASPGGAGSPTVEGLGGAGKNESGVTGSAGANGGSYATSGGGGSGGAAGYAIRRNGYSSPVTNNGSISGTVG